MNRNRFLYFSVFTTAVFITGCSNNEKPAGTTAIAPPKAVLTEPFRFHKMIEVSPGQDYDVFSWGRGSSTIGAFEILHSDSAAAKFTTTTGDLDGAIIDVFNTDMDLDGNPEILIEANGKDTTNYTHIYAFEFTYGKAEKLDFPRLTQQQRQGYRGGDNFYVKDGKLEREFPIYTGTGQAAKPSGQKRELEYGMRNNEFNVHQLSKDFTKVNSVEKPVVKQKTVVSKPAKTTKHKTEKKKKKKHRRHNSDEG